MIRHVRTQPGELDAIEQHGGAFVDGQWVPLATADHDQPAAPSEDAPRITTK